MAWNLGLKEDFLRYIIFLCLKQNGRTWILLSNGDQQHLQHFELNALSRLVHASNLTFCTRGGENCESRFEIRNIEIAFDFAFNFILQWNLIHIASWNRIPEQQAEKWRKRKRKQFSRRMNYEKFTKSFILLVSFSFLILHSTIDQHIFNDPFSFACSHSYIHIFIPLKKGTQQIWNTTIWYQICDESLLSYSIYYSFINW